MGKRIIAIVGATNAAGRGLVRAIVGDKDSRFTPRVVTLDVNTEAARTLAKLGAEVVVGHPGAGPGLTAAFAGAYGAFCVPMTSDSAAQAAAQPAAQRRELAETTAVAQAAKDAGLLHVIWATLGDANSETARMFRHLGIPATFLHPTGDPASLRGEGVAEEIGRCAYGIFKSGEYIGRTVSINADLLTGHKQKPPSDGVVSRKSRFLRARVIVPAILVLALIGVAIVRNSLVESEIARTTETGDVAENAEPPTETIDTIEAARVAETVRAAEAARMATAKRPDLPLIEPTHAESPPAPTVTSRWEEERAASMKRKAVAMATASKFQAPVRPPPRVRQKRPARPERATASNESAAPSRSEAPAPPPPRPAPVVAVEAPAARASADPPAPSPPPSPPSNRRVEPQAASPRPPGTIDQKAVTAVVRAHATEIRGCFDRAIMEHPELRGRLAVQATIDPDGHVLSASPASTIENGARLQSCVVAAFQSWTFPAPAGGVKGRVTYSFSFE